MARTRLREIRTHLARDKPEAAERLAMRIVLVVETLKHHPYLGRAGAEPGVRELVIGGTPCLVLYRNLSLSCCTPYDSQITKLRQPNCQMPTLYCNASVNKKSWCHSAL